MLLFKDTFGCGRAAGRSLIWAHISVSVGELRLLEQAESLSASCSSLIFVTRWRGEGRIVDSKKVLKMRLVNSQS